MTTKILVQSTHGAEDAERASPPFILANVAASADQKTVVFLTVEGVRMGTKGYAATVCKEGIPAVAGVIESFVAQDGEIWLCAVCTGPRGITEGDLIPPEPGL